MKINFETFNQINKELRLRLAKIAHERRIVVIFDNASIHMTKKQS